MSAHIAPICHQRGASVGNWSADQTARIEGREYVAEAVSVGVIIGSTERGAFTVSR